MSTLELVCSNCLKKPKSGFICKGCLEKHIELIFSNENEELLNLWKIRDNEILNTNMEKWMMNEGKICSIFTKKRIIVLQNLKDKKEMEKTYYNSFGYNLKKRKQEFEKFADEEKYLRESIIQEEEKKLRELLLRIERLKGRLNILRSLHINSYLNVLKKHDSYTDFSVADELKIDEEEYFKPMEITYEEDEGEKETVVMLLKDLPSFNKTHWIIMTEAFTRLADMVFFISKTLHITLPIKMVKNNKNNYLLTAPFAAHNSEFLLNLNMELTELTKEDLETTLTMLYMNFLFLCRVVGMNTDTQRLTGRKIMNMCELINKIQYNLKNFGSINDLKRIREDSEVNEKEFKFFQKTRIVFKDEPDEADINSEEDYELKNSEWEMIE